MDITTSFNQKNFLIQKANFTLDSHKNLISLIMERHGEKSIFKIKMIDDNDEYDSFLVESDSGLFCVKMSFDNLAIFYEFMILKGIEILNLSPIAIDRNELKLNQTIYYTIQSFETSENLKTFGFSSILESEYIDFYKKIAKLHTFEVPKEVIDYLDNTESFLIYQNENFFKNILPYVDKYEEYTYNQIKNIFKECYDEMMEMFNQNKNSLNLNRLVHGNLDGSTIIENSFQFKFINFENAFIGSPFFDIANLVLELQMTGLKEFDFVSNLINEIRLCDNRFLAGHLLNEYRICKKIWIRKKFLDLIKEFVKEVIVYNKTRQEKILSLSNEFSKHYYRFDEILTFVKNKELIIGLYTENFLNNN